MISVNWAAFTPWSALGGGLLIGLAAALLAVLNGRVAGISGILGGLIRPVRSDVAWRVAFVAGLLAAPWLIQGIGALYPQAAVVPAHESTASLPVLIVAGLLVGLGTRYGSGCTSGHGVCGMARLSARSVVATLAFMATGFLSVGLLRHLLN